MAEPGSIQDGAGIRCRDCRVLLPGGRLFVRSWSPAAVVEASQAKAPIVLFHDSLGCIELWREFPERLCTEAGRTVIAYDRLGFGQSDPHPGPLQSSFIGDEAVTAFAAIREQLGIGPFVAFGHSVGGGMALHCAVRFAGDCKAVITESAQSFIEARTLEGIREAKAGFQHVWQMGRLEKYHGAKARWVLDAWTETWLSPAFANWSLREVLPQVTAPLLAIHGALDEYGSPEQPALIARLAGGESRMEVLEGVHHVPHRQVESKVIALVRGFLDSIAAP